MKRRLVIAMLLLLLSSPSWAGTMYVTEVMTITMRTGPGIQNKIIAILNSGDKIDMIKQGEGWSYIRLSDGKEGWVLTRYLTTQTPTRLLLNVLNKKHDALTEKYHATKEDNTRLRAENDQLKSDLEENIKKLAEMTTLYDTLKADSSDFITVKSQLEETAKAFDDAKKNEKQLEKMVVKLRNNQILKGIMLGAGILLLGILLGSISKRQKRRSSLL